jgi:hypothetical protein
MLPEDASGISLSAAPAPLDRRPPVGGQDAEVVVDGNLTPGKPDDLPDGLRHWTGHEPARTKYKF